MGDLGDRDECPRCGAMVPTDDLGWAKHYLEEHADEKHASKVGGWSGKRAKLLFKDMLVHVYRAGSGEPLGLRMTAEVVEVDHESGIVQLKEVSSES